MDWQEAKIKIEKSIVQGRKLNDALGYRIIQRGPDYKCKKYKDDLGYSVQIGKDNFIQIPFSMLQKIFEYAKENKLNYNKQMFKELFSVEDDEHSCYVHTVGKIFEISGVAKMSGNRDYYIL
jgi:hypothetical protein